MSVGAPAMHQDNRVCEVRLQKQLVRTSLANLNHMAHKLEKAEKALELSLRSAQAVERNLAKRITVATSRLFQRMISSEAVANQRCLLRDTFWLWRNNTDLYSSKVVPKAQAEQGYRKLFFFHCARSAKC